MMCCQFHFISIHLTQLIHPTRIVILSNFPYQYTPVHKAIREALANCLVNTDFFIRRGVVIKKDIDQITLENPGSIRTEKKTNHPNQKYIRNTVNKG